MTTRAPYVFKVAISDHRIVKVENDQVTFRYRKPHSHRERTMTLHALAFIRRFLQPVLPSDFMKVRDSGFLHPSGSIPWAKVKTRIEIAYGFALVSPESEPLLTTPITCRGCGDCALSAPCCPSGDAPPLLSANLPWRHQDSPQPRRCQVWVIHPAGSLCDFQRGQPRFAFSGIEPPAARSKRISQTEYCPCPSRP